MLRGWASAEAGTEKGVGHVQDTQSGPWIAGHIGQIEPLTGGRCSAPSAAEKGGQWRRERPAVDPGDRAARTSPQEKPPCPERVAVSRS